MVAPIYFLWPVFSLRTNQTVSMKEQKIMHSKSVKCVHSNGNKSTWERTRCREIEKTPRIHDGIYFVTAIWTQTHTHTHDANRSTNFMHCFERETHKFLSGWVQKFPDSCELVVFGILSCGVNWRTTNFRWIYFISSFLHRHQHTSICFDGLLAGDGAVGSHGEIFGPLSMHTDITHVRL